MLVPMMKIKELFETTPPPTKAESGESSPGIYWDLIVIFLLICLVGTFCRK